MCDFKAVKENYNEDGKCTCTCFGHDLKHVPEPQLLNKLSFFIDSNTPKIAKRFSDSAPTEHCKSSSSWSTSSLKSSSQGSADINDVQDVLKDTQSYNASGTSDQANLEKLDEKNDTVEFGQPSEAEEDLLESKKVTMASPNATRNNNGDDKLDLLLRTFARTCAFCAFPGPQFRRLIPGTPPLLLLTASSSSMRRLLLSTFHLMTSQKKVVSDRRRLRLSRQKNLQSICVTKRRLQ